MSKVYLTGAGPGDPDLLTLKGKAVLEKADVVLHDHLASDAILDFAPPHAQRIYVGKKKSDHAVSQEEICRLMIESARAGKTVVRLKGGDPLLFGRGGEEEEALAAAGVLYEVVPGITAALGIAAYSGVPLTHRDHTSEVTFVTGHDPDRIDWTKTGRADTLIVYMGLTTLPVIVERLLAAGRDAATPAMVVRWATRSDQETVVGTLADIARLAQGMKPPATIFIGAVVALRAKLNWFEKLPLFGQRIVVTRAAREHELSSQLHALGAEVADAPMIEIAPPLDAEPLRSAIARLSSYDWLVFTSANAVQQFLTALDGSNSDLRNLRARICAVGPGTAAALTAAHVKTDLMPDEAVGESVVQAFRTQHLSGKRLLLPRAARGRDVVPDGLRAMGADVEVVEAYRTVSPREAPARLAAICRADWIVFTSSSTVKNFLAAGGGRLIEGGARIASIGPATSETCRMHGLTVAVEAAPHTVSGLVEAIVTN